jgi:Xaa-Pro aminopeptidase
MIAARVFAARRAALAAQVQAPVLLVGNGPRPRNFLANTLPFRQDSNFLYFTGCTAENAALLLVDGVATLYLPEPAADDALWHGEVPSLADIGPQLGVDAVKPVRALADDAAPHRGRLLTLAVPDERRTDLARRLTGALLEYGRLPGADALVDAIVALRRHLGPEELDEMRATARVTAAAHRAAMAATRPGRTEAQVAALFDATCAAFGHTTAYHSIVTVRGEVLHNHGHGNPLEDGQLLLLDGGAEGPSGYASDVTRTWPVSGRFSAQQAAAYQAVLEAQEAAIAICRPGTRYRDVHLAAARVLTRWLKDEALVHGDVDTLVEDGAHAVFFPHGVGHLLGLDVHDMEAFGDRAAYAPGRARSPQFGTGYLRLDLDLAPGHVVTIEPGFYVVPAILRDPTLRERFAGKVDFARAQSWVGFGGIRIEDDVAIHDGPPEVLSAAIPKSIPALEALVGTGGLTLPDSL